MAKTLRVRTRAGWVTKPAPDVPENRLSAEEVDDNFLEMEDGFEAAATAAGTSFDNTASGLTATDVQAAIDELAAEEVIVFPAGTRMLFQQTAAPTGWTKVTTGIDNRALRVVTGTAGSGGANAFTTAFNSNRTTSTAGDHAHTITVNNHTLALSEVPNRTGNLRVQGFGPSFMQLSNFSGALSQGSAVTTRALERTNNNFTVRRDIDYNHGGGGGAHNHGASSNTVGAHAHTLNLDVQYLDVIVAEKD